MSKLTEKQQNFVNLVAAGGVTNTQAAILAGYAENSASVQATMLMKRKDIQAAIKAARKAAGKPAAEPEAKEKSRLKDKYDSPKALLEDVMNNPDVPFGMRWETAKQLLPYYHAKIGEKGKKENAKDRAHEIAGTGKGKVGKRPRFAPREAPRLSVVK